jgi:hypothetical protein
MFSKRFPFSYATLLPAALLAGALLVAGCDSSKFDPGAPRPDDRPPLSPDVRMQVSYEQTEITFSNTLPPGLVGNTDESQTNAQTGEKKAVHMTEYEATRELRSYDEKGYLTAHYEYIDGNRPHMNMPGDTYNDLKSGMPHNAEDENPVVRSVLDGGTMKYVRQNGDVDRSVSVDPETFRMDPATLDSLEAMSEDSAGADQRRARVRERLQRRGRSLSRVSANHVAFTVQADDLNGVGRVRKVVDLRHGQPVHLTYELKDGRKSMVETRIYGRYNAVPIMARRVTYDYGDRNGGWGVVSRTETTRRDISVRFGD